MSTPRPTPLAEFHARHDARMVDFAGWSLPLQYRGRGIVTEHLHTRAAASLFDVSHMAQFTLAGAGCAAGLARVLPLDPTKLAPGRNKYSFACTAAGGVVDDLIVGNDGDAYTLVSNAARAAVVAAHLEEHLGADCTIHQHEDRALLAVQGPAAAQVVSTVFPAAATLYFMDSATADFDGATCRLCRCGYTGEDGFEIAVPATAAAALAQRLCAGADCHPAGLGARDTLRLEACLCLYGNELNEDTSPVAAGLLWAIPPKVRAAGGFIGAPAVLAQAAAPGGRRLVALTVPDAKVAIRAGCELASAAAVVGQVTSGGHSPTLGHPVALAYVDADHAESGAMLTATVRGQDIQCQVAAMPLVPHRYRIRPRKPKAGKGGQQ